MRCGVKPPPLRPVKSVTIEPRKASTRGFALIPRRRHDDRHDTTDDDDDRRRTHDYARSTTRPIPRSTHAPREAFRKYLFGVPQTRHCSPLARTFRVFYRPHVPKNHGPAPWEQRRRPA
jgi:hypothetical protein